MSDSASVTSHCPQTQRQYRTVPCAESRVGVGQEHAVQVTVMAPA
ncbi:hypothetical protein [Nocardia asteroides]|nr:hypothetical protein [Nocardia asteroides]